MPYDDERLYERQLERDYKEDFTLGDDDDEADEADSFDDSDEVDQ